MRVFVIVMCSILGFGSSQNLYSGPYSIFNVGPTIPQVTPRYVKGSCTKVKTVNFPLRESARRQPAYSWLINDSPANRELDNVCTTFYPLPDDPNTYFLYDTFVYHDGSSRITTTIATDINIGSTFRGNGYFTITQNILAFLDDNSIISCEQLDFGDSTGHDVYGVTFGQPPNRKLLGQISAIINSYNLAPDGLITLPFNHPPKCVLRQVCTLVNPLIDPVGLFFQ